MTSRLIAAVEPGLSATHMPGAAGMQSHDLSMESVVACLITLPSKALAAFAALALQGVGTAQDIDDGMKLGTDQLWCD